MKRRLLLSIICLIVLAIFSTLHGCAEQKFHVMRLRLTGDIKPDSIVFIPNSNKVNLYVERFLDNRGEDKVGNMIGVGHRGQYNVRTPILSVDSVTELSTKALQKTFQKAGFNVVPDIKEATFVLKGKINEFWVQEVLKPPGIPMTEHSEASIEFEIILRDVLRNKDIWFDVKRSYVKSKSTIFDTTKENERVINQALEEIIKSIINDHQLGLVITSSINSKR